MKTFRQKEYGAKEIVGKARELAPLASLGISTAALGATSLNTTTNIKRSKADKEYQKKQIKAMENLTKSLDEFDRNLKGKEIKVNINKEDKPKKRILRFFQKNNSKTAEFALKGAKIGAGVGIIGAGLLPKKLGVSEHKEDIWEEGVKKTDNGGFAVKNEKTGEFLRTDRVKRDQTIETPLPGWDKGWKKKVAGIYNNSSDSVALRKAVAGVSSIAIGATLGAIVGMVYDAANFFDNKNVDRRLMKRVVDDLKKMGFKEGQHFTVNPKTATLMKTKVCLGISRSADTLKLLVNTVNDPKLSKLSQETTKNLPSMSTRMERVTDRFNDINITTASGQGDSTFVSSLAEKFIRSGYPVQLVEVG